MLLNWEENFCIRTRAENGVITVSANRNGLLSLANLCRDLAGEAPGAHLHLDEFNSLEEGSVELILERTD